LLAEWDSVFFGGTKGIGLRLFILGGASDRRKGKRSFQPERKGQLFSGGGGWISLIKTQIHTEDKREICTSRGMDNDENRGCGRVRRLGKCELLPSFMGGG